ncbi:MAG: O-methyltransferase [Eubacteriales bacterium]
MGTINQDYIEKYIRGMLNEEDPFIVELEKYAAKENIPIIHKEVKQLLRVLIRSSNIKCILEIGTAIGYSAIVFSHAMDNKGQVLTIEMNENMIKHAKSNIVMAGLDENISILFGDANKVIYDITGTFDCIFLDGAKGHYIHLLEVCIKLLKPGGLIISDNVLFRGMIADDALVRRRKITIVKRMRRYLNEITNHPMLITSIIPIGDGLALSYKKHEM